MTCDHLDEDGALALFCLCAPERAVEHGALLVGAAAAGAFDTVAEPDARRVAFGVRHLFDPARSPLRATRARWTAEALRTALAELRGLLEAPGAYASWWGAEDAAYDAGPLALAAGAVSVEVDGELGLAVVGGAPPETPGPFARVGRALLPVRRAALHSATSAPRVLVATGGAIAYCDRYETWVRYRSRLPPRRRDLAPLAAVLSSPSPERRAGWPTRPPRSSRCSRPRGIPERARAGGGPGPARRAPAQRAAGMVGRRPGGAQWTGSPHRGNQRSRSASMARSPATCSFSLSSLSLSRRSPLRGTKG